MSNFKNIEDKLEAFIRRFYINELLKGFILFFAIGCLYFLLTLFIESVLWLHTPARTLLFWFFILVEIVLLSKFILLPLAKLFKLKKGIDYQDASKIIGTHFSEVNDKLLNVLQLKHHNQSSDLLLASIEQKSLELNPVPFKLAINLKNNSVYLKYAALPILILVLVALTGNMNGFSDSFERVTHYTTAYEPPAPFHFFVLNDSLKAIENKDFKLVVKTVGDVTPENAQIQYHGETYFLQQKAIGEFEYVFSQPIHSIEFKLLANNIVSKPYELRVIKTPALLSFKMVLDYPKHTKRKSTTLKGSGNTLVPEGTLISWQVDTKMTDAVHIYAQDTLVFNKDSNGVFNVNKRIYNNYDYTLTTSNKDLKDYENLAFRIDVIKDEYPQMDVTMKLDSLDLQSLYFKGQVTDDYGFTKLQMVYYPTNDTKAKLIQNIPLSNSNFSEFITAFPNTLNLQPGMSYDLYFEVFDNDQINRFKSVKSVVYTYRKRTKNEEQIKQLNEQKESISDFNKSLKNFEQQDKNLQELTKTQKEKINLNFNEKKKLESFLKRQKEQVQMMKNFNKKLKENLDNFQKEKDKDDPFKEDLKQRLQENEEQLKKDEKLLNELEKLADKINQQELGNKLEDLAKQNNNKKRSLEQLLELTKRFYVEKKLEKLKDDLEKLSDKQDKLANENDENTKAKQDALNKAFDDYKKELKQLEQDSKDLKKPIDIPRDTIDEKEIDKEQKEASENLEKQQNSAPDADKNQSQSQAKKNQKKAAQKMKELSKKMGASMSASGGDQIQEDVEMLRQVLDNLVLFSFDQEALMVQFQSIEINNNKYASYLRTQQNIKEHFQHIDDSLFAMSLRQPKISETVNKEITEVFFNIDKAMELLADNQLYQGVSKQQFAITAANNLADFLSNVLDNMQESLSMSKGQGQGDQQLPDIIMSQEELNKMMEQGLKKGEKGQPKDGQGHKPGDQEGKEGEQGKDGKQEGAKGNKMDGSQGGNSVKSQSGDKENGKSGGDGLGEQNSEALYKIYQKQQELRQALQERLDKEGIGRQGANLIKQMENIELDLLNNGLTNQTLQKMMNLKHQLLKLEHATFQQGEDNKRQSETNNKVFENNSINQIPTAKQYFKTTEILNRQVLPLQPVYKKKVQSYFKQNND